MSDKTHWKKLTNPNYVGGFDFEKGEKRVVTITEVVKEKILDQNGDPDEKIVLHFKEGLPLIMNKTNLKTTEVALKTPMIEDWVGQSITLYTKQVKAFGELHDAIRVESRAPKPVESKPVNLPILKAGTKEWDGAVKYIRDNRGSKSFDDLRKATATKYKISAASVKQLKEIYDED